jgi:hypothetical protein
MIPFPYVVCRIYPIHPPRSRQGISRQRGGVWADSWQNLGGVGSLGISWQQRDFVFVRRYFDILSVQPWWMLTCIVYKHLSIYSSRCL